MTSKTEFETLTAAHLEQYRPPTGAITHPDTKRVLDPTDVDTPERAAARLAVKSRWDPFGVVVGGVFLLLYGAMFSILAVLLGENLFGPLVDAPVGSDARTNARVAALIPMAALFPLAFAFYARSRNKKIDQFVPLAAPLRTLTVPADVASAYTAFCKTPEQLRARNAGEDAVAVVEARMGHMEDLLVEAARLHALGADATKDGLAVREQMITHAAKAQSLVVMAQRKAMAIADADAGTALVLARGADDGEFEQAGAQLAEDTTFVRDVLDGASILTALPNPTNAIASPTSSPTSSPILVAETEKEVAR